MPPIQPSQLHNFTYLWPTLSLPAPGDSLYPGTKFGSNRHSNRPTCPSSQCFHICRIQYPTSATEQHATYTETSDTDVDKPNRRVRKNQKPQHPSSSHSPGNNWTKTGATSWPLNRLCKNIFLNTWEVFTRRRSLQQQIAQASVYHNIFQQEQWKHIWVHLKRGVDKIYDAKYISWNKSYSEDKQKQL